MLHAPITKMTKRLTINSVSANNTLHSIFMWRKMHPSALLKQMNELFAAQYLHLNS